MAENMELNEKTLENVSGGVIDYDTGIYIYYTVLNGDCLSMIAQRHGCTTRILYALNRNVIGPNPDLIQPGMLLRIPVLN